MNQSRPHRVLINSLASSPEAPSTRWWESYLVRYFVGLIAGCVCIAIVAYEIWRVSPLAKAFLKKAIALELDGVGIVVSVALLGLGYCYVASTPITVLHQGRYSRWWIDAHSRHFWFGWIATIVLAWTTDVRYIGTQGSVLAAAILGPVALLVAVVLPVSATNPGIRLPDHWARDHAIRKWFQERSIRLLLVQSLVWAVLVWSISSLLIDWLGSNLPKATVMMWLLSAPVIWIGIVQYVVLARLIVEDEKVTDFYVRLFYARRQINAKDVRDTYTHMREHSNSVFIVVVELAALAFLVALARSSSIDGRLALTGYGQAILVGLAIWMLPTVFMWARANAMEKNFADNPRRFLSRPI